jgi:hypothetical protein
MTASGAGEGSSRCLGTTVSDIWVMVLIVCSNIWPASVDKIISSVYVRQCILLYKWVHLAVEKPCSGSSPRSNGQSQTWTFVIVTQNCPRVTEKAANIICIYLLAYTCVRIHTLEVHSLFCLFYAMLAIYNPTEQDTDMHTNKYLRTCVHMWNFSSIYNA